MARWVFKVISDQWSDTYCAASNAPPSLSLTGCNWLKVQSCLRVWILSHSVFMKVFVILAVFVHILVSSFPRLCDLRNLSLAIFPWPCIVCWYFGVTWKSFGNTLVYPSGNILLTGQSGYTVLYPRGGNPLLALVILEISVLCLDSRCHSCQSLWWTVLLPENQNGSDFAKKTNEFVLIDLFLCFDMVCLNFKLLRKHFIF